MQNTGEQLLSFYTRVDVQGFSLICMLNFRLETLLACVQVGENRLRPLRHRHARACSRLIRRRPGPLLYCAPYPTNNCISLFIS